MAFVEQHNFISLGYPGQRSGLILVGGSHYLKSPTGCPPAAPGRYADTLSGPLHTQIEAICGSILCCVNFPAPNPVAQQSLSIACYYKLLMRT